MTEGQNESATGMSPEARVPVDSPNANIQVGRIISRSFSVLFGNFFPFLLLSLLVTFIPILIVIGLLFVGFAGGSGVSTAAIAIGALTIPISYYAVMGALVFGTLQDLNGERATIGEIFSHGLSSIPPVLGVGIISVVLTFLPFLGVPVVVLLLGTANTSVILIAYAAIFFSALSIAIMLFVAIPVAVIEKPGVFNSLSRSRKLTNGSRWQIFFCLILIVLITTGLGLLSRLLFTMFSASADGLMGVVVSGLGDFVVQAMMSAFFAVVIAVTYHDLKVSKEGADSSQLAAVFD